MMSWDALFYKKSLLFDPLRVIAARFNAYTNWPAIEDYNTCLADLIKKIKTQNQHPIYFREQQALRSDDFNSRYEARIFQQGEISTRKNNWHDFFNSLVWATFPESKCQLNNRQYSEQLFNYQQGRKNRSLLENTLAQFDECGVIVLSADKALEDYLKRHLWVNLFYHHRETLINQLQFLVFGHGLYEQALSPFIGLTGKALIFSVTPALLQLPLAEKIRTIDHTLSDFIKTIPENKPPRELLVPVPILGIPYWYEHQNLAFYHNRDYFRPYKPKLNLTAS